MKVLVVNNMAPFVWGGAEELAVHLQRNLVAAGHESEILRLPFQWEPADGIPAQMLFVRAMELWNVDKVIALKFPAYLVRHADKVLWLLHQYRQAYDLYDAGHTNLPSGSAGDELRRVIKGADDEAFNESRAIFTNSEVTRDRLAHYNGFSATVLPPPVNDPGKFTGGRPEGYIFAGGRVNGMKRQHLLVEAMRHAAPGTRLIVAGPPDTAEDGERLRELVERYSLADRVRLDLRFLSRDEYAAYVNGANAVAYLPFDEDSLGYVAMEAATAAKPLISTTDSGGILGLAKAGVSGWVVPPEAGDLASALDAASKPGQAVAELGQGARDVWRGFRIDWPTTIEALLR
jgi:glycosyltransferase involved in cell wall biosynthesis